jgi:F420-0:gamma-glutamyl ligase
MVVTQQNVAGGLAAAATLAMGEGAEQTPLCLITDFDALEFRNEDPAPEELAETVIEPEDDLFAPFLNAVEWKKGQRHKANE